MRKKQNVRHVILETVRVHLGLSLGILGAVAGAIVMALLPPMLLGRVIDTLTAGKHLPMVLAVLYYVCLALTGILESVREGLLTAFGQKMTHALRSALMEKYTRLTTDALTSQEPGTVVSRFVGDVDTVENLFTAGIVSMFADACKIVSILVVVWLRNRGLALVLLVLLPGLYLFTRTVQKRMLEAQLQNRRAVGRASGYVPETVHNIRTIHCLAREKFMEERYDGAIVEGFRATQRTNFYDAVYSPVILTLNAVVVATVMLFSASGNPGVLRLFGMSAGTAVTVINYISQIFTPVESLGMEIQTIQSAVAGVHRLNEFFRLEERCRESGALPKAEEAKDAVRLEDVTFAYGKEGEKPVLNGLSLSVRQGEQVTLSGRTGAGKSTILKLLLGLYVPQSGKVLVAGMPASGIPDGERRKIFGYVEQSFHMVPGTVREQITLYDPAIGEEAVKKAARMVGLDTVIQGLALGYDTPCTPELFSQGQWQLLSIARAVAADPGILLLDEITASLDAQTETEVLEALRRSAANRTVISISHRTHAQMGRTISVSPE